MPLKKTINNVNEINNNVDINGNLEVDNLVVHGTTNIVTPPILPNSQEANIIKPGTVSNIQYSKLANIGIGEIIDSVNNQPISGIKTFNSNIIHNSGVSYYANNNHIGTNPIITLSSTNSSMIDFGHNINLFHQSGGNLEIRNGIQPLFQVSSTKNNFSFGLNSTPLNSSVLCNFYSNGTKVIRLPILTDTERNNLSALTAMLFFNITSNSLQFRANSQFYQIHAYSVGAGNSLMSFDENHIITSSHEHFDNGFKIINNLDNTKKVKFDVSNVTTGNERTINIPDKNGEILIDDGTLIDIKNRLCIQPTKPIQFLCTGSLSNDYNIRVQNISPFAMQFSTSNDALINRYFSFGIDILGVFQEKFNINGQNGVVSSQAGYNSVTGYYTNSTHIKDVTEILTNKTISGLSNVISNIQDSALSNNIVDLNSNQTLLNKKLNTQLTHFNDNIDNSKSFNFDNSSQTTSTNRVYILPDNNGTLATTDLVLKNNTSINAPAPTDDSSQGYNINSIWTNSSTHSIYICTNNLLNNAKWYNVLYKNITFQNFETNSSAYVNIVCWSVLNRNAKNGWAPVVDPLSGTMSIRIFNLSTATSIVEQTGISGSVQIINLINPGNKFFITNHTLCLQVLKSSGGGNVTVHSCNQY